MFDDLPPFMTVRQAADVLQVGRSKGYELTAEWEHSGGQSGPDRSRPEKNLTGNDFIKGVLR